MLLNPSVVFYICKINLCPIANVHTLHYFCFMKFNFQEMFISCSVLNYGK